jgi:hypothetical protein
MRDSEEAAAAAAAGARVPVPYNPFPTLFHATPISKQQSRAPPRPPPARACSGPVHAIPYVQVRFDCCVSSS